MPSPTGASVYHEAAVNPALLLPAPLCPGILEVPGDEAHHALRVLRLRAGDPLRVLDGAGRQGQGELINDDPRRLLCRVERVEEEQPGPAAQLCLALAAPKGERFDAILRGATELGVGALTLLRSRRSVRLPESLERPRRVLVSALKQCGRCRLPRLAGPLAIGELAAAGGRLILCDPEGPPADPGPVLPTTLIVGPEGGFTAEERDELRRLGAESVRLAGHILRIETAALAATAVWVNAWEQHGRAR